MIDKRFSTPWALALVAALATAIFVAAWTAGWGAGPDLAEARNHAAAMLQEDGRLLVSGGEAGGVVSATAEALDGIGFFTPVASMQVPRQGHAGVRLSDGNMLVVGGITTAGSVTSTAEVYDPVADSWTTVGPMGQARSGATALLLPDGRVLVVGGDNAGSAIAELEIYDPVTQTFGSSLTVMQQPRTGVAAALLLDGRVLISGGTDQGVSDSRTDLYDPVLDTLVQAQDLLSPRAGHSATRLSNGRILIAGGFDGAVEVATAELYDPISGIFLPLAASMSSARQNHIAVLLPHNGSVLIIGGTSGGSDLLTVERYLPWTSTFAAAGSLTTARPGAAASPTGVDGALLVLGGGDLSSTELYNFSTLRADLEDYRPGDTALITGAGFPASTLITLQVTQLAGTPGAGSSPWEVVTDGGGGFMTAWTVEPEVTSGATFRLSAESSAEDRAETLFRSSQRIGYVTVGDQIGDAEYATPSSVSFAITVGRGSGTHSNGAFDAALSVSAGLPAGALAEFDPPVLSFGPADTLQATTLTITTDAATPAGAFVLSLLAQKTGGGVPDSAAQDGFLTLSPRPLTITAAPDTREYDAGVLSVGVPTISSGSLANSDSGTWIQTFDQDDVGARLLVVTPDGVMDGNGGNNYLLSFDTAVGAITARPITVTAASDTKEYDSTTVSAATPGFGSGSLAGSDTGFWSQVFDSDDAGARILSVIPAEVEDGNGGANYAVTYSSSAGSISPRALLITAAEDSRTYDSTIASSGQPVITLGSLAPGDAGGWAQEFDAAFAGARTLSVLPATVQDGNGGANYALSYATAPGLVLPAGLILQAVADNRAYDGTTSSAATPTFTGSLFGTDSLADLEQAFDQRNAGERILEVSGYTVNDGNGGGNYALTLLPASGTITPAALELIAAPDNRIYDGTVASSVSPTTNGTLYGPDSLTDLAQEFDSRHAGARTLTVSGFTLDDGNAGANYAVTLTAAAGAIDPRDLTVSATAESRVYDSTTSALESPTLTAGSLVADDSAAWTQVFDGDDAGARLLTVTPSIVNDSNGGANYLVSYETAVGSITPAPLDIVATSDSRSYDGTALSTAVPTSSPFGADTVTGLEQVFDDKNAGPRTLTVSTYQVNDGNAGANYSVNLVPAAGSIEPAVLELIAAPDSKTYDGSPASAGTPTYSGSLFGTDSISGLGQEFDSRNAGERSLTVTTYTVNDDNGGANYAVSQMPAAGTIAAAPLELIASPESRIYDGTVASSVAPTTNGTLYGSDSLTDLAQEFDSRHAGARTLTVSGFTLDDGNAGANYAVTLTSAAGAIDQRDLTVSATAESRVYDNTTTALESPTLTAGSLVADDSAAWTQVFDGDDAGARLLTVTPSIVNDSNGGANYLVSYETAVGSITPAPLDIVATSDSRSYDGTALSTALPTSSPFGADTVTGLEQVFDDKNAGPRTLAVSTYQVNDGNAGANYTVNLVSAAGSIEPAILELIAAPDSKTYDGSPASAGTPTYSGSLFGTDSISGLGQEFDSRNAGERSLTVTTYTVNDDNGGANYAVSQMPAAGTIAAAPLELIASPESRIYDGTVTSSLTPSTSGTLYGPDSLTDLAQEFDSRHAGVRTLTVSGFTLDDGNAGANYAVTLTAAAGSISPRDLTVSAASETRVYDSTTTALESPTITAGSLVADDSAAWAQVFDGDDAGARLLTVTPSIVNDGNAGANYLVSYETAAGSITPAPLDIVAASDSRSYDGTALSTALPTSSPFGADTVTGLEQVFDDKNAGPRTLAVSTYQVNDGNAGANYTVNLVPAAGSIEPAILELIAAPDSKTYDGSAVSTGTPTYSGALFGTDSITGLGQEFDSRNAGERSLTVTTYTVNDDNGGANYAVSQLPAAGTIAAAPLELIATPDSRIYDGTTASSATPSYFGTLHGTDSIGQLLQEFDSRNAGARTLTVAGQPINDGNGGANYSLTFTNAAGSISPREIKVKPSAEVRNYDGTARSIGSAFINEGSLAEGDFGSWGQNFYTRHVGNPRWLEVAEADVNDGNGGDNYNIIYQGAAGAIHPAPLDIVAANDSRPYDATDVSGGLPTSSPFSGDTVTGLSQKFDSKDAGPRTLVVTSYQVNDGNDGLNYSVNLVPGAGAISPAVLDVYTTADSKTYDGNPDSVEVPTFTGSLFGADTLTDLEQAFDSRDAGARSLILSSYQVNDGVGGANYQVLTHSAAGSILPRALTIAADGIDKVFDNSTTAIVTLSDDRLAGDFFTISYASANFARKMPGTWPVEVLGLSISGAHAGNYLPNNSAVTAATISIASTLGTPRGPVLRQPYLSQLHLHGSLSEGSATMHSHTQEAIRIGYDLLWWSDHMERVMARMFVNHMSFEGSLTESQAPGVNATFNVDEPVAGFLDLSFGTNAPALGSQHLTVGFDSLAGEPWTSGRLVYEADRRIDHKSLMADPEIVIQVRPQVRSGDATFMVRLTLSARPDGTITGIPNVLEYVPAGMNMPDPTPNVRRLPLPALQTGVWNQIALRPGLDAPPLFYEGLDQALYRVDLVFLTQNGGSMTMDLDAFNIGLLGLTDLALIQAQSAMVESLYSANIHQEVGMEVAGPDAQGVPFNHNDHLVALYPNGVTSLIDFTEPGTNPDLYPQSAIDRLHSDGALVCLAHIFGPGNGDVPISDEDAIRLAARIIAARAWGCEAMEVGYPWRQKAIQYHVDVWDILSRDGVFITGTAVSDNHNVEYWDVRVNRWGSWLRSIGPDAPSWLEAIRGGQVFFGDPNRFEANGDLVFAAKNGAFSMGDVVPIEAGPVQFRVAVNGAAGGDTLVVLLNGEFLSTHPLTTGSLEITPTVSVAPGDFVRVEMRDELGQPYLFSNPIYFVPTGQQPPPHRAPGP